MRPAANGKVEPRSGFTLIEVLVAISVLAICVVAILELFSGGLKAARTADEYNRAVFHAREKMEEVLTAGEWEEGIWTGEFEDGVRWRVETTLLVQEIPENLTAEEAAALIVDLPFDTLIVSVAVYWGEGSGEKHFVLETTKLVEAVQEQG